MDKFSNSTSNPRVLNKREIEEVLSPYSFGQKGEVPNALSGGSQKIQSANPEDFVFYNISNKDSVPLFLERLELSKAGIIFVNSLFGKTVNDKRVFETPDTNSLEEDLYNYFLPLPQDLKLIGVTGTNGKTSVTNFIYQMLNLSGLKTASLGTLGIREFNGDYVDLGYTTPPYGELRKILHEIASEHKALVMEVSSHGLSQGRLRKISFHHGAWTNFTQDHLDYHGTMANYFEAKKLFLKDNLASAEKLHILSSENQLAESLEAGISLVEVLEDSNRDKLPRGLSTGFNLLNISLAWGVVGKILSNPSDDILSKIHPVPGRFEEIQVKGLKVIIDYAHTPDALQSVLIEAKKIYPNKKLIVLFGCGGDRDKSKRSLMGKISDTLADIVIVTSDNPRTEDPENIISDILEGIQKNKPHIIVDRKTALEEACKLLDEESVLVVAGKGHEEYQIIGTDKIDFSDHSLVRNFLNDFTK